MDFDDASAEYELVWLRPDVAAAAWWAAHPDCLRVPGEPAFALRPTGSPHPLDASDVLQRRPLERDPTGVVEFHTNKILLNFPAPCTAARAAEVLGAADRHYLSLAPLETGAPEDWTWIVELPPGLDVETEARAICEANPRVDAEPDRIVMGTTRDSLRYF